MGQSPDPARPTRSPHSAKPLFNHTSQRRDSHVLSAACDRCDIYSSQPCSTEEGDELPLSQGHTGIASRKTLAESRFPPRSVCPPLTPKLGITKSPVPHPSTEFPICTGVLGVPRLPFLLFSRAQGGGARRTCPHQRMALTLVEQSTWAPGAGPIRSKGISAACTLSSRGQWPTLSEPWSLPV